MVIYYMIYDFYEFKNLFIVKEDIEIEGPVGSGTQGEINLVKIRGDPKDYIMKRFFDEFDAEREFDILYKLRFSKFVPKIKGWSKECGFEGGKPLIITEFYPHAITLDSLVAGVPHKYKLEKSDLITITYELIHAVRDLHINGIAHQDIKPENVLYDLQSKRVYLIDLASACEKSEEFCELYYTNSYVPSDEDELYKSNRLSPEVPITERENDRTNFKTIKAFDYYAVARTLIPIERKVDSKLIQDTIDLLMANYDNFELDKFDF